MFFNVAMSVSVTIANVVRCNKEVVLEDVSDDDELIVSFSVVRASLFGAGANLYVVEGAVFAYMF